MDFRYKGVIKMAPKVHKLFDMAPDMATVPFGFASKFYENTQSLAFDIDSILAGSHTFVVADPALKLLENSTFVSNGRIIVHENGLTVETRQSLVIASTDLD